jgi:PhzF family phenazine biosynthesis protein
VNAFGIDKASLDKDYPFIILDNGYLYIYLRNLTALKTLNPDFKKLKELSLKCGFSDINLFTLETFDETSFAHSRFFSPQDGIIEDPVTGSANGPLMLVLIELGLLKPSDTEVTKVFEQGDIIGRKGRVTVSYSIQDKALSITGSAVTVFKGELYI